MALTKKINKQEFEYVGSDNEIWDVVYFETPDRKYMQIKMRSETVEQMKTYDFKMLEEIIQQLSDSLHQANFNNLQRPSVIDYRTQPADADDLFANDGSAAAVRTGVDLAAPAPVATTEAVVTPEMEEDISNRMGKVNPEAMI